MHLVISCKQNNRFTKVFTLFLVDVRLYTALSQLDSFMLSCQNLEMYMHRNRLSVYMIKLAFFENWCSERHSVHRGLYEICPVFYIFHLAWIKLGVRDVHKM